MRIEATNVIVTGTNRGLGQALVTAALEHGAAKVYATARDPSKLAFGDPRVVAVELDLTDQRSVDRLADDCRDADILINNAAYLSNTSVLRTPDTTAAQLEMDTNYWGLVRIVRAMAPHLAQRGGGAIVNILSIGALVGIPFVSSYCASKAAAWLLTQSMRAQLAAQRTHIMAVFPGPIATDMAREHQRDGRCPPDEMAEAIISGIMDDERAIFPDEVSRGVAAAYAGSPWSLEAMFADALE